MKTFNEWLGGREYKIGDEVEVAFDKPNQIVGYGSWQQGKKYTTGKIVGLPKNDDFYEVEFSYFDFDKDAPRLGHTPNRTTETRLINKKKILGLA